MEQIPTINYHDLKSNNVELSKFLEDSLNDVGFFVIKDHPISSESIDKLFNFTQELFDLPLDVKMKYHLKGTNGARGYTPYGIETALNKNVPDQKEFWHHGPQIDPSFDQRIPANLIIKEVPDFNKNFDELYIQLHKIGSKVLSVIALSLDLDSNYFDLWIEKGNSLLRSIHYPPVNASENPHRARAHEDINLITLLIGAEEGGLEILNNDGSWIKVNPSSNAIVCNIGDMLQLVTEKKLKSQQQKEQKHTNKKAPVSVSCP